MTDTLRTGLEQLARQAPASRTPDAVAAQLAWRSRRRRWRPVVVLTAALACSMVLLATLTGVLTLTGPAPAQPARGSGALPARIVVPPTGTPLVTESPVERAAYVIATGDVRRGTFSHGIAPVVVSADDGAYRVVPWHDGDHGISLSPDGRRLAWVVGDSPLVITKTVVLTLATGELREVPGSLTAAVGTAWSADGSRLLVWGGTRVSQNAGAGGRVEVRDAATLRLVDRVEGSGPAAQVMGHVVVPTQASTAFTGVVPVDRAVVSPGGERVAQITMLAIGGDTVRDPARLVIHPAGAAPDGFTPVVALPGVAYAEALVWTAEGVVVAEYSGSDARGPARVVLLDPATGSVVRTLTTLPPDASPDRVVDVDPQVVAVSTQVLDSGQVSDMQPRTWPWHSLERLRWWASNPLRAGLQIGLGALPLVLVVLLVRMARRP